MNLNKPKVILDTNMLMMAGKGFGIFEQIEEILDSKPVFIVLSQVKQELEKIANTGSPRERKAAAVALELIKAKCIIVDLGQSGTEGVDELIIEAALREKALVATNDRKLRKKLREKGLTEIYFREEKSMLESQSTM
ncbi:MAG: 30S processome protein Utp24 [Desulfurococcaceae archaeon]